jgi:predicted MPP superfamily phosphohydrolase
LSLITRRTFVRHTVRAGIGLTGIAGFVTGYGLWEAAHIRVTRQAVPVPNLPSAFAGKTVAVLADLHHGPFVGIDFIRNAVRLTNALGPDMVALVGDYAHRGTETHVQLAPCLEALSALSAPLGVFAVPGNHDMQRGGAVYRELIAATPLTDLTNANRRVSLGAEHLWVAGVDDLWWGKPNLNRALDDVPAGAAVILLAHNPDFAEDAPNGRVGLVLSGHTHGGQVYLRGLGSSWLPSKYGAKYRYGLVQGPASNVFVSRGLGEAGVPLRINAPPEVCLLTLAPV